MSLSGRYREARMDDILKFMASGYVAPEIGVNFVKPWVIHIEDGDGQEDH